MADLKIAAETRTEFGKGAARRIRRADKVPAVLYGHGVDPQHLAFDAVEFARVMRLNGRNAVLSVTAAAAGGPSRAADHRPADTAESGPATSRRAGYRSWRAVSAGRGFQPPELVRRSTLGLSFPPGSTLRAARSPEGDMQQRYCRRHGRPTTVRPLAGMGLRRR